MGYLFNPDNWEWLWTENNARFGVMRIMRAIQQSQLTAGGSPDTLVFAYQHPTQPFGFEVEYVPVDGDGRVDPSEVAAVDRDGR